MYFIRDIYTNCKIIWNFFQWILQKLQLLKLQVPAQFMMVALDEGPGPPIKYQHAELSKLYSVVSQLVRCCDVSQRCHSSISVSIHRSCNDLDNIEILYLSQLIMKYKTFIPSSLFPLLVLVGNPPSELYKTRSTVQSMFPWQILMPLLLLSTKVH